MTTREEAMEELAAENPEACFADGFEEAFIGACYRFGQPPLATYDLQQVLQILMRQGLSADEAREHFEFNILGAWVGDGTPVFIDL